MKTFPGKYFQEYIFPALLKDVKVIDSSVVRIPNGKTGYAPGSYSNAPSTSTSIPNLFIAGDYVRSEHGSFNQEKAYVSGLEAVSQLKVYQQAQQQQNENTINLNKIPEREDINIKSIQPQVPLIIPVDKEGKYIQFVRKVLSKFHLFQGGIIKK